MPKLRCPCGYVHNLSPIPDDGWITIRSKDYERLIELETRGQHRDSTEPRSHVKLLGLLYRCPECDRIMWQNFGEREFAVFRRENESDSAIAQLVHVSEVSLMVELTDGRTISAPLTWYPRLLHGTPGERDHWRLIDNGRGIHWPDLDEDISVGNLLAGKPSGESQPSLKRWLEARKSNGETA